MSVAEMSVRKRTAKEQLAYDMGYQMGKHDAVRHGRWINEVELHPELYGWVPLNGVVCSECGRSNGMEKPYCPNCGATMDAEK